MEQGCSVWVDDRQMYKPCPPSEYIRSCPLVVLTGQTDGETLLLLISMITISKCMFMSQLRMIVFILLYYYLSIYTFRATKRTEAAAMQLQLCSSLRQHDTKYMRTVCFTFTFVSGLKHRLQNKGTRPLWNTRGRLNEEQRWYSNK